MVTNTTHQIYWLLAILLWGTVKLIGSRIIPDPSLSPSMEAALAEENRWTFGQLLPVILLIGPVLSFAGTFALHDMQHTTKRRDMRRLATDDVSLESLAQNDDSSAPQHSAYPGYLPRHENGLPAEPAAFHRYLESYEGAPWLPVCVIVPGMSIFAGTCMAFFTAFDFTVDFRPEFTLYDVWVGPIGLIYLLTLGYPGACVVSILLGLMLERWLQAARTWRKFCYFLYCVAVYGSYYGVNIVWMAGVKILGAEGYVGLLILSAFFYCIYSLACLCYRLYRRD